jgi:hypothetical protein
MLFGPLKCQFCGKEYMVNERRRLKISKFCSKSCRGSGPNAKKAHHGVRHPRFVPLGTQRNWKGVLMVKTRTGWEREHRAVAGVITRPRGQPRLIVHHRNGDPTDNRPENLAVMTQAEHAKLHDPERQRDAKGRLRGKRVAQQVNSALVVEIA